MKRVAGFFLLLTTLCASTFTAPAAGRIVAVGDVHGAFEPFVAILTKAGLVDAQRRWAGGTTVLVQTGDVTDRGAGVREVLDLLIALETQAAAAGGRVHALLGNHEIMNMVGDTRDVSPEVLQSFGGDAAYRAAFGPGGKYGRWLRSKSILVNVDGTVFMHAGINLEFSPESLDELNRRARREVAQWDEGRRWLESQGMVKPSSTLNEVVQVARTEIDRLNAVMAEKQHLSTEERRGAALILPVANIGASSLFHVNGPVWFRGFATWTEEEGPDRFAAVLKHHKVKRFVTGHTVQQSGEIAQRFGGSLFLIDTGMLNGRFYPNGRASALEISGSSIKPVYLD